MALLRTGVYTPEPFLEKEIRLGKEQAKFQHEIESTGVFMYEINRDAKELPELLKDLYLTYKRLIPMKRKK